MSSLSISRQFLKRKFRLCVRPPFSIICRYSHDILDFKNMANFSVSGTLWNMLMDSMENVDGH